MTAPSTAHSVEPDIARDAEPLFRLEPHGNLVHWWGGEGLVRHLDFSAPTEGPCLFFETGGHWQV
jgi:hypothetical protein